MAQESTIGVLHLDSSDVQCFIPRDEARALVKSGSAAWVNRAMAIRLVAKRKVSFGVGLPTDQARRYEGIALETFPHKVGGGLARTEHQPARPNHYNIRKLTQGR